MKLEHLSKRTLSQDHGGCAEDQGTFRMSVSKREITQRALAGSSYVIHLTGMKNYQNI